MNSIKPFSFLAGLLSLTGTINAATPELPPGSWSQTCETVSWDGRTLEASCHTGNPDPADRVESKIQPALCLDQSLENIWGDLKCEKSGLEVGINSMTFGGTGCEQVAAKFDGLDLVVTASGMTAEVGPGVPRSASRKFCQLALDIKVPEGFQYAVTRSTYSGSTDLQNGTDATLTQNVYFSGSGDSVFSNTYNGPQQAEFQFQVGRSPDWSPCSLSRFVNIKLTSLVKAQDDGAAGKILMDGTAVHEFSIQKCDSN